jgi:hypothetical protein
MPLVSAINLVVLARTKRLERYVNVLIVIVHASPPSSSAISTQSG